MAPTPKRITDQLWAQRESERRPVVQVDLAAHLFPKQMAFVADDARFGTVDTSRRAGKTIGVVAKLARAAAARPGSVGLYITLTRIVAKRNAWAAMKSWAPLFGFTLEPNESELCVKHPNGSCIYLLGAKDRSEVEKFRGLPISIVIIDESQSMPGFIENLVDEVLAPSLMDYAGSVWLVGTPGPVPVGYFWKATQAAAWAHHRWTAFDNPHLERKSGKTVHQLLAEELVRRGVASDEAVIQREWFGRWVLDENSLVFRYNAAINNRKLDVHNQYVIGGDLGWDDADALAVLGWSDYAPETELVHEWTGRKQTISALCERLKKLVDRYQPLAVVLDTGGLGKKIAEELTSRTGIAIEAADRHRKLEHIELLNDALRTGKVYAPADGQFAQDCLLVEWDKSNPEKPEISDRFHSDICDAVLYAWRRSLAWLHEPKKPEGPARNTPEWLAAEAKRQQREVEEAFEQQFEANQQKQQEDADQW